MDSKKLIGIFQLKQGMETFRYEKRLETVGFKRSEFWNFRFKTKSWNFVEVRWRP